jgi:hypothetical protein
MTHSGHWQCFIANLGIGCPRGALVGATLDGRLRTIAVTHQRLLLLAFLLASPIVARAAEGTATVPRFEPAPCPKLPGATGEDIKVVIDGGALVDWLRNQNYAVPMLQAAPNRIDGLAAGRPDAIALDRASRAPPPGPDVPALGYGLSYGVSCRGSYPFATPEDLAAAGRKAFPRLSGLDTTRGRRRLGIFRRGLPRSLEGPRCAGGHAPARR